MLQLTDVAKTWAKSAVPAVDGLSLTVNDGEIFGFLGPNGAGKTTTIKVITGIVEPDRGQVMVGGADMAQDALRAKSMLGYVPDNPELFARLKAIEYLNFMADIHHVPTAVRRSRIEELAGHFALADVLGASIGSYSRGMKQKLNVLASLIHDPAVWILDEPMVGLDPRASFQIKVIMRARAGDGKCVFFSTHVMEVAEKICDRLAIINRGRIVYQGSLAELQALRGSDASLETLFLDLVEAGPGATDPGAEP